MTDALPAVRDTLGRAHYERMRLAMLPDLPIATWDELPPAGREAYRRRLDYLAAPVTELVTAAIEGTP